MLDALMAEPAPAVIMIERMAPPPPPIRRQRRKIGATFALDGGRFVGHFRSAYT
jgi:hypothetical protein